MKTSLLSANRYIFALSSPAFKGLLGLIIITMLMALASPRVALGEVYIDINRGNVQPLPIAVVNFSGNSVSANEMGQNIKNVIEADLERSGLFSPVDEAAFIAKTVDIAVRPRFSDWRLINAQALVHGKVEHLDGDNIRVEFRLWDVFAETQMQGISYRTKANNWRRISHVIADAIYERITGETGYFDSRIVYIAESGPGEARQKRLAIMDQDGANHRYLTDGRTLVLTPRFSPAQQEIAYLSYFNGVPRVYIFNLQTGAQRVLGAFDGMTFAPRFSPDGNQVVMSYAHNGRSNIHVMNLETRQIRQLTNNSAIDTAPSFAPDGQQITFESDRGGSQQLYVMNKDGTGQKRISFGTGSYATPVWSPRGDLIAFTKITGGQFHIGVMRPDGSGERLLAKGFHNEGPTWSPNGRVLLYFREIRNAKGEKESQIISVDLTGQNQRRILTPTDASDPAWSPLNP